MTVASPTFNASPEGAGKTIPLSRKQSGLRALFRYRGSPLRRFEEARDEIGDVMAFTLLGDTIAILHDPKVIEAVLVTEHARFRKDAFTRQLTQLLGAGLLTSEDDHWRRQRRLIGPAMQPREMQRYVSTIAECAAELVGRLPEGRDCDVHSRMMHLTLDILGRTLFGQRIVEFDEVERELDRVMQAYRPLSELVRSALPAWVPLRSRSHLKNARIRLDAILRGIIEGKRSSPLSDDLLSRLVHATDEAGGMTDKDLRDEAMTLFLAGHETTALALTYALRLLGEHPGARQRVEDELDLVLSGRLPTPDDVPKLIFTRAVVQETLRLYPPAWVLPREAKADSVIAGWRFPRGVQVLIPLFSIHRDPRWFEDPTRFCPERFLPGGVVLGKIERKELPRFAYMPFGAGPRVCVGQHFATLETITALATLLSKARFTLASTGRVKLEPAITLRPKGPVILGFTRRMTL